VDADIEPPASRARFTTPCANGPSKNSGKIVSTWKITRVQFLQTLGQFHRDAPGGRLDLHANGARKRNQQPAFHFQQPEPPPSCQPVTRPSDCAAGPLDHFAADQVRLEKLARLERSARLDAARALPHPAAARRRKWYPRRGT
jgi:hypothetical protein